MKNGLNIYDYEMVCKNLDRLFNEVREMCFSDESLEEKRHDSLHYLKIAIRISRTVSKRLNLRFRIIYGKALFSSHQDYYRSSRDYAQVLLVIAENKLTEKIL